MKTLTSEIQQPVPSPQDTRRSPRRRTRLLVIGGAGILLFAVALGAFIYGMIAWTTSVTSPASAAAEQYYTAIAHQQYAAAYSHLGTQLTYNGVLISEEAYTQAATRLNATEGNVIAYSISNVSTSWNFGQNTASATVHITRTHRSYDVHLSMKLEGTTYKITSFDGI